MDPKDFTENMPGQLVRNMDGHWAFVPSLSPPKIAWTDQLVKAISEAEAALGRLAGLGDRFPQPKRLMRLFLRREAELSSRIENTYAGVRTQLLFKFVPNIQSRAGDVSEVNNNYRVLEKGVNEIARRPLSLHLLKQLHQILLKEIDDEAAGRWRTVQAHIGQSNKIEEARFVPAPPHAINDCMVQLEHFIRHDHDVPRIAKLAIAHYQFEAIHPFSDGNGRIGRALILLLILEMGLIPLPLFNPSAYLESNRRQYYDHLLQVSQRGDWNEWIIFFSRGIVEESAAVSHRIDALERLRRSYHEKIRSSRASAKVDKLIDELFRQPVVQLTEVMKFLDAWPASATRYIEKLVSLDILREVSGKERNRVYLAHEIVRIFSAGHSP